MCSQNTVKIAKWHFLSQLRKIRDLASEEIPVIRI